MAREGKKSEKRRSSSSSSSDDSKESSSSSSSSSYSTSTRNKQTSCKCQGPSVRDAKRRLTRSGSGSDNSTRKKKTRQDSSSDAQGSDEEQDKTPIYSPKDNTPEWRGSGKVPDEGNVNPFVNAYIIGKMNFTVLHSPHK